MELYFTPGDGAELDPNAIVAAARAVGLDAAGGVEGDRFVLTLHGSRLFVDFQQNDGRLSFAMLDVPMSEDAAGNAMFCVLQELGWVSEEDVG